MARGTVNVGGGGLEITHSNEITVDVATGENISKYDLCYFDGIELKSTLKSEAEYISYGDADSFYADVDDGPRCQLLSEKKCMWMAAQSPLSPDYLRVAGGWFEGGNCEGGVRTVIDDTRAYELYNMARFNKDRMFISIGTIDSLAYAYGCVVSMDDTPDSVLSRGTLNTFTNTTNMSLFRCCQISEDKILSGLLINGYYDVRVYTLANPTDTVVVEGSVKILYTGSVDDAQLIRISDTKVLFVYEVSGVSYAKVLTISGSSVTVGASNTVYTGSVGNLMTVAKISETEFLYLYSIGTSTVRATLLTVDGDTVTGGTEYTMITITGEDIRFVTATAIGNRLVQYGYCDKNSDGTDDRFMVGTIYVDGDGVISSSTPVKRGNSDSYIMGGDASNVGGSKVILAATMSGDTPAFMFTPRANCIALSDSSGGDSIKIQMWGIV